MDASVDPLTLLGLQIDWGADEALAEAPVNRLDAQREDVSRPDVSRPDIAPSARLTPAAAPAPAPSPRPALPKPPPPLSAATLEELRATIGAHTGCALRDTATNPVPPEGDPAGGLLVIGEPPVAEDDRAGRPFSGPAGAVLDRILGAIGLRREEILLAPLIPWRPPGNRPPTDAELAQCLPFLHLLIAIAAPRHVILTGTLPVRALLGGGVTLRRVRGRWAELRVHGLPNPVPALPTLGLGNLKSAAERRDAWADWRMLHRTIHVKS